ncbi:MAG: aminotransferase class V-fold PLP-dependent enzyme [Eubacteriales bacterium]
MIYFDNAATTFPKPRGVRDEVARCLREYCGNPGRGAHRLSLAAAEKVYDTRRAAAALLGSDAPENVVFTLNTTYALNIALKSLIPPRCHVVISSLEHNSVYRAVRAMGESGVEYTVLDIPDISLPYGKFCDVFMDRLRTAVRPDTKAVAMTHVSNLVPIRLPAERVGAFCAERGLRFILDAAQSAGIYDIDITSMNIDAVCAPGHKALYGPQGVGMAVFNPKYRDVHALPTIIEGGSGVNSAEPVMPAFLPERFEAGTLPTPAIAGLCEGIRFVSGVGTANIRAQLEYLGEYMTRGLTKLGAVVYAPQYYGESVLFNVPDMTCTEASRRLDDAGICTRPGLHCAPLGHKTLATGDGAVRASFSYFNTTREIDAMLREMRSW